MWYMRAQNIKMNWKTANLTLPKEKFVGIICGIWIIIPLHVLDGTDVARKYTDGRENNPFRVKTNLAGFSHL